MKALLKQGTDVEVREIPTPIAKRGEVVVRVVRAGICRTDVYVAQGLIDSRDPVVLGHEFSGVVSAVGPEVSTIDVGARVTAMPILSCGRCQWCAEGDRLRCPDTQMLGVDRDGAFAEFVAVPAMAVHALPEGMSFEQGAYIEPVAASTAVLGVGLNPSDRGLIYGTSRIARLTLEVLLAAGFERVSMGDGAQTPNSVDFVIETEATTAAMAHIMGAVRPGGTVVLKSRQHRPVAFHLPEIVRKELVLKGAHYGPFAQAIEWVGSGRLQIDDILGPHHPLEAFEGLFEPSSGERGGLKQFFAPSGGR